MPNVETIYKESVKPLPLSDQLRLAEIIVKRAHGKREPSVQRKSVLEILASVGPPKKPRSAAEIDEYLRKERDSWDD